jgi:hypothetical protein
VSTKRWAVQSATVADLHRNPSALAMKPRNWLLLFGSLFLPHVANASSGPSRVPLEIRFDSLSAPAGLTLTISTPGDGDGTTTFANTACCGVKYAGHFIQDVRIYAEGHPLDVTQDVAGWTVRHAPRALLRVTYRLPPSGPMKIDVGVPEQLRPIVEKNMFHVISTFGLLLPTGRLRSAPVALDVDATRVADDAHFVSSFGSGSRLRDAHVNWGQVSKSIFLGGAIKLSLHDTATGKVAISYSGMAPGFSPTGFTQDALAILAAERGFFKDHQPWFLVSLHGGTHKDPTINLGGGTGLTNSFAMFSRADLDANSWQHREQTRLVLAHEYFHNWNGLTLRVNDASAYWFSEGMTEFYALRMLARSGLMSPERALKHLNSKLARYAANSKRGVSAKDAGGLFWSDADGEQIPYLRGYLSAWMVDSTRGLDEALLALVARAEAEETFSVDNAFLADYLAKGMSPGDAESFRRFVLLGGAVPLSTRSFMPCLLGREQELSGTKTLQFDFATAGDAACFRH